MKRVLAGAQRLITWLAVLWTIYEEQRHLALYLGDREVALGIGEYIDIVATIVLLVYASYEVFHFVHRTQAFDRWRAAYPACDALAVVLLAALAWGIFRDLSHFQHLYLGAEGTLTPDDDFDEVAAGFLGLGLLKTLYHARRAAAVLRRLSERGA